MGKNLPVPIRRRRGQLARRASAGAYLSELSERLDRVTALGQPRPILLECNPRGITVRRLSALAAVRYARIADLSQSPPPSPRITVLA